MATRQLKEDLIERTVKRTLQSLGFDTAHPLDVQKDMAALREIRLLYSSESLQADMKQLRTWRLNMEARRRVSVTATITTAVTLAIGAVWARAAGWFG